MLTGPPRRWRSSHGPPTVLQPAAPPSRPYRCPALPTHPSPVLLTRPLAPKREGMQGGDPHTHPTPLCPPPLPSPTVLGGGRLGVRSGTAPWARTASTAASPSPASSSVPPTLACRTCPPHLRMHRRACALCCGRSAPRRGSPPLVARRPRHCGAKADPGRPREEGGARGCCRLARVLLRCPPARPPPPPFLACACCSPARARGKRDPPPLPTAAEAASSLGLALLPKPHPHQSASLPPPSAPLPLLTCRVRRP